MVSDGCTVTGNTANENGRNGIIVGNGCTVTGNTARSNQFDGISVANGCTVTGNTATNNTGDGIQASGACRIFGNTCDDDGAGEGDGAGIHTTYSENHIEGNSVTGNDRGIDVDGIFGSVIGSIIIRNTASGNTTNYDIANGNTVGEILDFSAGRLPAAIPGPISSIKSRNGEGVDNENATQDYCSCASDQRGRSGHCRVVSVKCGSGASLCLEREHRLDQLAA